MALNSEEAKDENNEIFVHFLLHNDVVILYVPILVSALRTVKIILPHLSAL